MVGLAAGDNASTASTIMLNLAEVLLDTTLDLGNLSTNELNQILSETPVASSLDIATKINAATNTIGLALSLAEISLSQAVHLDTPETDTLIVVDTTPPTPLVLSLHSDTGRLSTDRITSSGLISVGFDATQDSSWSYSINGGSTWARGVGTSFNLSAGVYDENRIKVKVFDAAGNSGISSIDSRITIDQTAPSSATLSFTDTGSSMNDNITSNGTISVSLSTDIDSWAYSTNAGRIWEISSNSTFTLEPGIYSKGSIQVKQTDLAGNYAITSLGTAIEVTSEEVANTRVSITPVDTIAPSIASISVRSDGEHPKKVTLTFNETLHSSNLPETSAFTITTGGTLNPVTAVAVSGKTITLTVTNDITSDRDNTLTFTDPTPQNDQNTIQDGNGNDAASFTLTGDDLLLYRIKDFASTLIDATANVNFPMVRGLSLAGLKEGVLNQLDSMFTMLQSNSATPLARSGFSPLTENELALGFSSTPLDDIFSINPASKTFSIKFDGIYNFGELPIAKDAGFDWGSDNTVLKMGLNVDADIATTLKFDLSLTGGWENNPWDTNFDVWINQTVVAEATESTTRSLSGSYLTTSVDATLSETTNILGNLGPLTTTATDISYYNNAVGNSGTFADRTSTGLVGFAEVRLKDEDGYNIADLLNIGTNFNDSFDIYYGANSQLALDVNTSLYFNSAFDKVLPDFNFDLFVPMNFAWLDTSRININIDQSNGILTAYNNQNNNGWVYLDNLSIEVGDLINTLFNPILDFVDPLLQKIKPLVDFLQYDLVAGLRVNDTGSDLLSDLIKDVTKAINWLPGPDISLPTAVPTANQLITSLLLEQYDRVDLTAGEEGKVRVIDLLQGLVAQMDVALDKLAPLIAQPTLKTIYDNINSLLPYLKGTLVVIQEVSDFMASYYDFVDAKEDLIDSQYRLDFGTLAYNMVTGEFDTTKLNMPWAFSGVTDMVASSSTTDAPTNDTSPLQNISAQAETRPPELTPWNKIIQIADDIGFNILVLSNPVILTNLLLNNPADLVTFKPDFTDLDGVLKTTSTDIQLFDLLDVAASIPQLAFLMPVANYVDIPFNIRPDITVVPRIEAGIDNYAIINKANPDVSILDSIYFSDNIVNGVDLPELQASIDLTLKALISAGKRDVFYAEAGAGLGIASDWTIDLVDPNNDGKVRGTEFLNLPNLAGSADLFLQAYGGLDTLWGVKYGSVDVFKTNLFSFDTTPPAGA
jgi:hypothetical protein